MTARTAGCRNGWCCGALLPTISRMQQIRSQPALEAAFHGDHLDLVAAGAWTARHCSALEALVAAAPLGRTSGGSVSVDIAGIRELDTFGAWLLERLMRAARSGAQDASFVGVPTRYCELLAEVGRANWHPSPGRSEDGRLLAPLEGFGRAFADSPRHAREFLGVLGALGAAFARALARPKTFRLTSAVHQLDRVAWQAVGIVLLITLLIGCIIAQQGFFHFREFGADDYVVDLVAILVVREIGVLIVAIMVAGRSGSSYTAELGSMKMREELDALRTMGLDPVEVLMLPRVLALVCALPILTFIGNLAALYGGGLVAWLYGGMSPAIYIARLQEALSVTHFAVGMIKAPFMALVIGVIACVEGLRVQGSAESLGLRTTASVVTSIFLVIVLDGLFAMFFASIGM